MAELPTKTIAQSFVPLFSYVLDVKANCADRQPAYNEVRHDVMELLEESAADMRRCGFDPRDYDDARFAVSAWTDETIMSLPWMHRNEWQRALLQTELYGSTAAGEEFFDRLNQLTAAQNNVREVYYFCLALGFSGRFCHDGDDIILEQLKKSTLKLLGGNVAGTSHYAKQPMFGRAYPAPQTGEGTRIAQKGMSWSASKLWLITVPPLLLVLVFVIYTFVLGGVAENLMARVAGG